MAKEIKSVVRIGMDYTEVVGGTTEVNRRIRLLDSEFRKAQESARAFGTSVDELRNKQDYLTQKVSLQSQKVKNMRDEYEKIRKEKGDNSKEAERYATSLNYAERQLIRLEGQLKETSEQLADQSGKFEDLRIKMAEYGEKAEEISQQTGAIGNGLLKASAPLMAFSIASGKAAMDFEEAMAKVSLMVNTNEVDMEKLGNSVKALSNQYGISTKIIANALYETMSAGVDAADSIQFLDVALKNGRVGIADTVTSVNTLTNVMNAYEIETDRAIEVSDKLIKLQEYGKTTIGEFGNEIGRLAPLASQTGMSFEEMFGSIATLTRNSIQSSQALTGMRSIISGVIKPTAEATEEAKRLGLQFNASALQGKGFERFLEDVMRKTRGNTDSLTKLFGNVNALNAIMLLTSDKGARDFREALDEINNATGTTDEGMEKLDTTSQRLRETIEVLKNSFADAGIAILPILNNILKIVTPLFELISKIPEPVMMLIAAGGMFLAMSGGILKTISGIALGIGVLTGAIGGFTIMSTKAIGIVLALVAALTALLAIYAIIKGRDPDMNKITDGVSKDVANMQNTVAGAMKQPRIPGYARGTRNHPGGLAIVGEEGPELVDMPRGSRVYTNRESAEMLGRGDTYNLYVNMDEVDEVYKLVEVFKDFKQAKRAGVVHG